MKKLLTICLIMATVFTVNAQETKQFYIVFETQDYAAKHYVNGKQEWKPEVPYKKYVRFITTPFNAPADLHNSGGTALSNQLAKFIYDRYLTLFEKLKFQNTSFNFSVRDYKDTDYAFSTEDCKNCNYQHEKTILDGFTFTPIKEYTAGEYNKKMHTFITGKEWGKW
jgi:hypothetical protein